MPALAVAVLGQACEVDHCEDDGMAAVQLRREQRKKLHEAAVEWYDPLDPAYVAAFERERSAAQPGLISFGPLPTPSPTPSPGKDGRGLAAQAQEAPQEDGSFQQRDKWNGPPANSGGQVWLKTPKEVRSANGLLDVTLEVTWGWVEMPNMGIRVRTRLYNGTYPGPTLRVMRGDHVRVKVVNKLGPNPPNSTFFQRREGWGTQENPEGVPKDKWYYQNVGQMPGNPSMMMAHENNFHTPNSTNLHVHGWHVSPHLGQDEVVETKINPGETFTYNYELSPYHSSGNSWYHGHLHGTTMVQTSGGMLGALIIDDSVGESPEWIRQLPETVLIIHQAAWGYFGPDYLKYAPKDSEQLQGCFPFGSVYSANCATAIRNGLIANVSGDSLWKMEYAKGFGYLVNQTNPLAAAFTVNGQYQPTVKLVTGEWHRARIIFGGDNFPLNIIFNQTADGKEAPCEMRLIAKDSNWLQKYPRKITRGVFLGAGSRCQVIVRCSEEGTFALRNNMMKQSNTDFDMHQTMLFVQVEGPEKKLDEPEEFFFSPPRYLNSLLDLPTKKLYSPHVAPSVNFENGQPLKTGTPDLQADGKTMTTSFNMVREFGVPTNGKTDIPPAAYEMQPVRYTVQNKTFSDMHPFAHFPVAEVLQLEMMGIDTHPWHMHVNPAEVQSFGFNDIEERYGGFFRVGDFQDVFLLPVADWPNAPGNNYTAVVRFQTDCYTGQLVLHCHVLYHEDLGMMTYFNMTGKDHTVNKMFQNKGIFKEPPAACMKKGQQCAPAHCTDYKYAPSRR